MACANKVFVFSGFRDDVLKAQIEEAGGKVAISLVKAATHVLMKRDGKPSKKLDEAREKGLELIFLDDFLEEHDFHLGEHKPRGRPKKSSDDEAEIAHKPKGDKLAAVIKTIEQLKATLAQLEQLKIELSA